MRVLDRLDESYDQQFLYFFDYLPFYFNVNILAGWATGLASRSTFNV